LTVARRGLDAEHGQQRQDTEWHCRDDEASESADSNPNARSHTADEQKERQTKQHGVRNCDRECRHRQVQNFRNEDDVDRLLDLDEKWDDECKGRGERCEHGGRQEEHQLLRSHLEGLALRPMLHGPAIARGGGREDSIGRR